MVDEDVRLQPNANKPGNAPQQQNPVNEATLNMAKTAINFTIDTGKKAVKKIKGWFK